MRCRTNSYALTVVLVALLALLGPGVALAQQTSDWSPPRLGGGKPDLQGVWDFRTATPLQRPERFEGRETLTEEEAAAIESRAAAAQALADRAPREGSVGAYNAFWLDFGTTVGDDRRTSLIVDPPTGRLPELADGVDRQVGSLDGDLPGTRPVRIRSAGIGADGPEDRGLAERCLLGFNSGRVSGASPRPPRSLTRGDPESPTPFACVGSRADLSRYGQGAHGAPSPERRRALGPG